MFDSDWKKFCILLYVTLIFLEIMSNFYKIKDNYYEAALSFLFLSIVGNNELHIKDLKQYFYKISNPSLKISRYFNKIL